MNAIREPSEPMGGDLEMASPGEGGNLRNDIEHWKTAFRDECRTRSIAL